MVRPRGTVVLKTTVASPHRLPLAPIVIHEVTIVGSRCGPFDKAIEALTAGKFELDDFVSNRFRLEDFQAAFTRATKKDAMKVVLEISQA